MSNDNPNYQKPGESFDAYLARKGVGSSSVLPTVGRNIRQRRGTTVRASTKAKGAQQAKQRIHQKVSAGKAEVIELPSKGATTPTPPTPAMPTPATAVIPATPATPPGIGHNHRPALGTALFQGNALYKEACEAEKTAEQQNKDNLNEERSKIAATPLAHLHSIIRTFGQAAVNELVRSLPIPIKPHGLDKSENRNTCRAYLTLDLQPPPGADRETIKKATANIKNRIREHTKSLTDHGACLDASTQTPEVGDDPASFLAYWNLAEGDAKLTGIRKLRGVFDSLESKKKRAEWLLKKKREIARLVLDTYAKQEPVCVIEKQNVPQALNDILDEGEVAFPTFVLRSDGGLAVLNVVTVIEEKEKDISRANQLKAWRLGPYAKDAEPLADFLEVEEPTEEERAKADAERKARMAEGAKVPKAKPTRKPQAEPPAPVILEIGDRVAHEKHGAGTVHGVLNDRVKVEFDNAGDKTLKAQFLTRLDKPGANLGETAPAATPPAKGKKKGRGGPRPLTAFGWIGGKFHQLDSLLPFLEVDGVHTFIDAFGGGGCVTANRKRAPVMIFNDRFGEVTGFFSALRDQPEKLVHAIQATPYARAEFEKAIYGVEGEGELDEIECARRFFVRAAQSRFGITHSAKGGQWSTTSRTAQKAAKWANSEARLRELSERFKGIQIENRDALQLIKDHGSNPNALIYCDPPYLHGTRNEKRAYGAFEMSDADHRKLAAALIGCKAKVAVSGFDHPMYDELYPPPHWHKIVGPERRARAPRRKGTYKKPENERFFGLTMSLERARAGGPKLRSFPEPSTKGEREARPMPEPVTGMKHGHARKIAENREDECSRMPDTAPPCTRTKTPTPRPERLSGPLARRSASCLSLTRGLFLKILLD